MWVCFQGFPKTKNECALGSVVQTDIDFVIAVQQRASCGVGRSETSEVGEVGEAAAALCGLLSARAVVSRTGNQTHSPSARTWEDHGTKRIVAPSHLEIWVETGRGPNAQERPHPVEGRPERTAGGKSTACGPVSRPATDSILYTHKLHQIISPSGSGSAILVMHPSTVT